MCLKEKQLPGKWLTLSPAPAFSVQNCFPPPAADITQVHNYLVRNTDLSNLLQVAVLQSKLYFSPKHVFPAWNFEQGSAHMHSAARHPKPDAVQAQAQKLNPFLLLIFSQIPVKYLLRPPKQTSLVSLKNPLHVGLSTQSLVVNPLHDRCSLSQSKSLLGGVERTV